MAPVFLFFFEEIPVDLPIYVAYFGRAQVFATTALMKLQHAGYRLKSELQPDRYRSGTKVLLAAGNTDVIIVSVGSADESLGRLTGDDQIQHADVESIAGSVGNFEGFLHH